MKKCRHCGNEMEEDRLFCDVCNWGSVKKGTSKKSKIIIISMVSIVIISSIFFGISVLNSNKQANIRIYKSKALLFEISIVNNSILLEDVASNIQTYWHDYIYDDKYESIEDAVSNAINDNYSNISKIKNNHTLIYDNYKEIIEIPKGINELSLLNSEIKNLYNNYKNLYNLVVSPNGNYNDFVKSINSYDDIISNSVETIQILTE